MNGMAFYLKAMKRVVPGFSSSGCLPYIESILNTVGAAATRLASRLNTAAGGGFCRKSESPPSQLNRDSTGQLQRFVNDQLNPGKMLLSFKGMETRSFQSITVTFQSQILHAQSRRNSKYAGAP